MEIKDIYIFGKYYKNMALCGRKEKIYECDQFAIELTNGISITAIAHIDKNGYYFNIIRIINNGKIYRNSRYFIKYITLVRDSIYEYYQKNK